jgi:hypothetical protein
MRHAAVILYDCIDTAAGRVQGRTFVISPNVSGLEKHRGGVYDSIRFFAISPSF